MQQGLYENKYVANNFGAAEVEMNYEYTNGVIYFKVAPKGTAGSNIGWITYAFKVNEFDSPKQIKAPKFVDRDNTGYYVDPSGSTKLNKLYVTGAKIICFTDDCTVYIKYDPSKQILYIKAPNVKIETS